MNEQQRLREIEEVLTVILQEQEQLKAEMKWLRAERDRAEERITRLEQAVEAQQQPHLSWFAGTLSQQQLHTEQLLFLLTQPQMQN